jgi:hypothetical protein
MDEKLRQAILDEEHLKLLSIGYMIRAAISMLASLFGLLYVFIGALMEIFLTKMPSGTGEVPPPHIGLFFFGFGLAIFLGMIAFAILQLLTGVYLKRRKARPFCMVVAGLSCILIPYGTLLGVFTLIVLARDSVKPLFEAGAAG